MSFSPEQSPKSHKPLNQAKGADQSGTYSSSPDHTIDPVAPPSGEGIGDHLAAGSPKLHRPPSRPLASSMVTAPALDPVVQEAQQPIPPPNEPMQYRAIGLVRGQYTPLGTQLNRGTLLTPEGTSLDTVLLGRVISLIKNHLDLEQTYLWVVYPRTREDQRSLHLQILGVWEPEELSKQPSGVIEKSTGSDRPATALTDGYFSIRGEVTYQSLEQNYLVVKIQQSPRKRSEQPKSFKLRLEGVLSPRAVGYFWNLDVQRQGSTLVLQQGSSVGVIPPKKLGKAKERPARQRSSLKPVSTRDARLPLPERVRGVERPIKPNTRHADI